MPLLLWPISAAIAALAAGVLFWAAVEKVKHLNSFSQTVREIGVPAVFSHGVAVLLVLCEALVGIGLLCAWNSFWPEGGMIVLALLFSVAGVRAWLLRESINCNCFGRLSSTKLGLRQLLALPISVLAVVLFQLTPDPRSSFTEMTAVQLALMGLFLASARATQVLKAQTEARGDRESAQEMYEWLRSR
jgi:hypothetical protein